MFNVKHDFGKILIDAGYWMTFLKAEAIGCKLEARDIYIKGLRPTCE